MSLMGMLCNIDELIAFLVKMTFWPMWPQMTPGEFLDP